MRLGVVWFAIPYYGLNAYIIALVAGHFLGSILQLRVATKTTGIFIDVGDWVIKPLVASISGIIAARTIKALIATVFQSQVLQLMFSGGITGSLMIGMLILMGVFEIKDIRHMIPFNIDKYRKL